MERDLQFEERRKRFLNSQDGVNASNVEFAVLVDELEKLVGSIRQSAVSINYEIKKAKSQVVVLSRHAGRILNGLRLNWRYQYSNSLSNAELEVSLWEGHPPFPGVTHWKQPYQRESLPFAFDLLKSDKPVWVSSYPIRREFDSKSLAAHILKHYLDDAHPKR